MLANHILRFIFATGNTSRGPLARYNMGEGMGGQCAWSPGSNRSAGVVVLVHPNSAAKLVDSKNDLAGRVVTALIEPRTKACAGIYKHYN